MSIFHPLQLAFGFTIWAIWFVFIYVVLSVACTSSPSAVYSLGMSWVNIVILISTVLIMFLLLFVVYKLWRVLQNNRLNQKTEIFIVKVALILNVSAAFSTLIIGATALYLPPCL